MRTRRLGLRGRLLAAAAVLGVLLLPSQVSVSAFTGTTGTTGSWQADQLDPPTNLTATRPCPVVPAFRGVTTGSKPAGTPSQQIDRPVEAVQGDVLVAIAVVADPTFGQNATAPTGWTPLQPVSDSTGGSSAVAIWKAVGANEPAGYTFTTNAAAAFVVLAYSGVQVSSPIAASAAALSPSGAVVTAPSVSPSMAKTLLVTALTAANEDTIDVPAGQTARASAVTASPVDVVSVSDEVRAAAGATGTRSGAIDPANTGIGISIALRPVTPPVALSWTPTTDTYATGYQLVRTGGGTTTVNIAGRATAGYSDTTTTAATAYSYALRTSASSWRSATAATVNVTGC